MDYGHPLFNSTTTLLALLGHPVAHSKSPLMHNTMLLEQKLPYCYFAFDVMSKEELSEAVVGLKALGARGWNVTVPYKEEIIPYLDKLDPEAERIGAVNTVVNDGGILTGYNTDARGFILSLQNELGMTFSDVATALIIGAGGAARAIVFALLHHGVKRVIIANRTLSKADELAESMSKIFDKDVHLETVPIDKVEELSEHNITIVINTTSVGLKENESPVSIPWLTKKTIVSDLIYNPKKTLFLVEAERKGCTIHNGLGMFIYQGALAYELWTGKKPNINVMRNVIEGAT